MTEYAISVALGVLVLIASATFFFFGRRAGERRELERQRLAKATAEEESKRILDEARRESENLRKSAVLAGKEELIKAREEWELEARKRR